MTAPSIDNARKTNPYVHFYPKFAPKNAETGEVEQPSADALELHASARPGVALPTEGFTADPAKSLPQGATSGKTALIRQAEVLRKQIGAGRHTAQYVSAGAAALGLAVACGGHPLAGFIVAAVGVLAGLGLQKLVRQHALKKVGENGVSGEQFKAAFEGMLAENGGVVNDPALETARKTYDFLTRSTWDGFKHDLAEPTKRAAMGALRLLGAGVEKLFSTKKGTADGEATEAEEPGKQDETTTEGVAA